MTKQDRQDLLAAVTYMVLEDFGEAPDDTQFNPFSPSDVARQAVIMLQAAYEELGPIDEAVDQILSNYQGGDPDIDNIVSVS